MRIVPVRNQITLETVGEVFELDHNDMVKLSTNPALDDELEYYTKIASDVQERFNESIKSEGVYSRKILSQNNECISLIQFLFQRDENYMSVYMRSSSSVRLPSDLGFLSRLAIDYDISLMTVTIGSFHVILAG